jgi:S1-C subfamily serine protease
MRKRNKKTNNKKNKTNKWYNRVAWGVISTVLAALVFTGACSNAASSDEAIFASMSKSVIMLTAESGGGGTGFLVRAKSGKSVTMSNWHVCRLANEQGYINAKRAGDFEMKVRVKEVDPEHDLCILEAVPGSPIRVGKPPALFSAVYVLGHPLLRPQTPSKGVYTGETVDSLIYQFERDGSCAKGGIPVMTFFGAGCQVTMPLSTTTAIIYPGNSGSPAVDGHGELIGAINSSEGDTHYGAFIPLRFVEAILERY